MIAAAEDSTEAQIQQCRRLAGILTRTRQMLVHAENDEWDMVVSQELERRADLAACFAGTASEADSVLIAEGIASVLYLNEELMAKLKTARSELMKQGLELSRNRSAVGSYIEVGAALQSP